MAASVAVVVSSVERCANVAAWATELAGLLLLLLLLLGEAALAVAVMATVLFMVMVVAKTRVAIKASVF